MLGPISLKYLRKICENFLYNIFIRQLNLKMYITIVLLDQIIKN